MANRTLLCSLLLALCSVLPAQTVKNVSLSHNTPYADNLTLTNSKGDVNVTATLLFNEEDNTVSISLQSERMLFVFWQDIRYRKAFPGRRLRAERLVYSMTGNTSDSFRRCRRFAKDLPRPKGRHLFRTWATAEGLQPADGERRIVNDSVGQIFSLPDKRTDVTIRLRDLLLLNEAKQQGVSHTYDLSFAGDINTEYRITLQRAPCLKMEPLITHTGNVLTAAKRSYHALEQAYPKHTVPREEDITMFNELKQAMRIIFPADTDSCACQRLMALRAQYNEYADSIAAFDVTLDIPIDPLTQKAQRLDSKLVFYNARQLDANVSRWLASNDQVERSDLFKQNRSIIADTNTLIKSCSAESKEEKEAVALFREAEQYFYKSCK